MFSIVNITSNSPFIIIIKDYVHTCIYYAFYTTLRVGGLCILNTWGMCYKISKLLHRDFKNNNNKEMNRLWSNVFFLIVSFILRSLVHQFWKTWFHTKWKAYQFHNSFCPRSVNPLNFPVISVLFHFLSTWTKPSKTPIPYHYWKGMLSIFLQNITYPMP